MLKTGPIAGGTFKAWGNRPKFAGPAAASSSPRRGFVALST
jgi:hypothetical protein